MDNDNSAVGTGSQMTQDSVSDVAASLEATFRRELGVESKEESSTSPAQTPDKEHPKADVKPEASDVEKPAEQEEKSDDEGKTAPAKTEEKADEKDEPAMDESIFSDLLEVESENEQDVTKLQSRLSEKDRYIGQLGDQLRSINEALASAGRKLINTPDGLKMAATDDAPEFKPEAINVKKIVDSLKPEEMDLFVEKPEAAARLIAERTIKEIANRYMPIQASANDSVLTQEDANQVYTSFVEAKLSDGKTQRFPDANSPKVSEMIRTAYEKSTSPAMQKFKELASKDKDVQYIMLEYLYNKVFRATHAQQAKVAAMAKAKAEVKEKHAKEPSVSTSGASASVKGQQKSGSGKSWNDIFAQNIAAMA